MPPMCLCPPKRALCRRSSRPGVPRGGTRNGFTRRGARKFVRPNSGASALLAMPCPHAMNANFPGSPRRESASKGQCDAQRGLPPVTAMIAELIATIEMPATRPAKRAMRWSFAVYARAELMKVLPEPGSIDPVRAQPVVRSARVRGGCPAHGGRVRPAACSFCINLRPAWSPTIQYA